MRFFELCVAFCRAAIYFLSPGIISVSSKIFGSFRVQLDLLQASARFSGVNPELLYILMIFRKLARYSGSSKRLFYFYRNCLQLGRIWPYPTTTPRVFFSKFDQVLRNLAVFLLLAHSFSMSGVLLRSLDSVWPWPYVSKILIRVESESSLDFSESDPLFRKPATIFLYLARCFRYLVTFFGV